MNTILSLCEKIQFHTSLLPVFLSQSHYGQNSIAHIFFGKVLLKGILSNAQKYAFEATNSDFCPQRQKETSFNVVLITNLMQFFNHFLMCLFHFSTCFEQPSAHHQENQLCQYIIWYISLCVGGRQVCRSLTCIPEGWGCGDWMDLAQDRERWRALVSTVMNFWVP